MRFSEYARERERRERNGREIDRERERKRDERLRLYVFVRGGQRESLSLNGMCLCVYLCVERAKRAARPSIVGL